MEQKVKEFVSIETIQEEFDEIHLLTLSESKMLGETPCAVCDPHDTYAYYTDGLVCTIFSQSNRPEAYDYIYQATFVLEYRTDNVHALTLFKSVDRETYGKILDAKTKLVKLTR